MTISRRAKFVRWLTSGYMQKLDVPNVPVETARRHLETIARTLLVRAIGVPVEASQLAGIDVDWLRPKRAREDKLLLYLHGGAYVLGSRRTHRQLVSHMARAAGVIAVVPEYRLAPEHPFPAAIDDAVAVYRALLESGFKPQNIVISGDSAGGGLSVATLLCAATCGRSPSCGSRLAFAVSRCDGEWRIGDDTSRPGPLVPGGGYGGRRALLLPR